jgi:hypothetical protein
MNTNLKAIPLDVPDLIISVEQIRHSPKSGPTLAYADIRVGPVTIFGVSVVENKNGKGNFVGLPFVRGSARKFPIIELDEETKAKVYSLVLEAWEELSKQ